MLVIHATCLIITTPFALVTRGRAAASGVCYPRRAWAATGPLVGRFVTGISTHLGTTVADFDDKAATRGLIVES